MKITHLNSPFPYILIDDFYSENELSLIWEELLFLCYPHKMIRSSPETNGAMDANGNLLKHLNHVYLDHFYSQRHYSNILNVNRKLFNYLEEIFWKHESWFYKNLTFTEDYTQVSYYENGDEYQVHQDSSMITSLSWFYKEPKSFTGGDLFFPEYDVKIEVLNNRMIIFPSHIFHYVDKVMMEDNNKKSGRFCISNFLQNTM